MSPTERVSAAWQGLRSCAIDLTQRINDERYAQYGGNALSAATAIVLAERALQGAAREYATAFDEHARSTRARRVK